MSRRFNELELGNLALGLTVRPVRDDGGADSGNVAGDAVSGRGDEGGPTDGRIINGITVFVTAAKAGSCCAPACPVLVQAGHRPARTLDDKRLDRRRRALTPADDGRAFLNEVVPR